MPRGNRQAEQRAHRNGQRRATDFLLEEALEEYERKQLAGERTSLKAIATEFGVSKTMLIQRKNGGQSFLESRANLQALPPEIEALLAFSACGIAETKIDARRLLKHFDDAQNQDSQGSTQASSSQTPLTPLRASLPTPQQSIPSTPLDVCRVSGEILQLSQGKSQRAQRAAISAPLQDLASQLNIAQSDNVLLRQENKQLREAAAERASRSTRGSRLAMRVSRNNVFTLSQLLADRENQDRAAAERQGRTGRCRIADLEFVDPEEWVDNNDYKDAWTLDYGCQN
ncbi:hypothetical protein CBOM_06396 [Ceraceosorus bombacis]|uniref:Uncharacterized protein n=1 Tax=Ceraceosorus bombacis TaxID=401625 RepID=A0A0P1BJ97_9BASI|nr:hypothetical protein CBOM_06396 [Ceraceosorus bombacis]